MSLIENLTTINNCKKSIKTALKNKGVDMTGVTFDKYASKIDELKLESGNVPTQTVDYIYSNGYVEGGTQDIMTYISYEIKTSDDGGKFILDDNGNYTIELFSPIEFVGWMDLCPDIILGVDVPTKYELVDIEVYDIQKKDFVPHGYRDNIRHSTVVRDGITYNSYIRGKGEYYENSDVKGDPGSNYKYRITIKLK